MSGPIPVAIFGWPIVLAVVVGVAIAAASAKVDDGVDRRRREQEAEEKEKERRRRAAEAQAAREREEALRRERERAEEAARRREEKRKLEEEAARLEAEEVRRLEEEGKRREAEEKRRKEEEARRIAEEARLREEELERQRVLEAEKLAIVRETEAVFAAFEQELDRRFSRESLVQALNAVQAAGQDAPDAETVRREAQRLRESIAAHERLLRSYQDVENRAIETAKQLEADDTVSRAVTLYSPKERESWFHRYKAAISPAFLQQAGPNQATDQLQSLVAEAEALRNKALEHRETFSRRNQLLKATIESLKEIGFITGQPELMDESERLGPVVLKAVRGAQSVVIRVPIGEEVQTHWHGFPGDECQGTVDEVIERLRTRDFEAARQGGPVDRPVLERLGAKTLPRADQRKA
jgi:hypothetical protein